MLLLMIACKDFWRAKYFRLNIESLSLLHIEMRGNFVAMFALNPDKTTVLSCGGFIEVHLPVYGHNYICLSSNIGSNTFPAK